jgi:hypothetical protein
MLPGFRFVFAAVILSMSILVFGLGAAALLRAAHLEFASMPSRRVPPEPVFAQPSEPQAPTLALLRVDPPLAEKVPDVAAAAAPVEQAPDATPPAEPEKLAVLKADDTASPEAAMPENPTAETTPALPAAPAQTETPASTDEPKLAANAETPAPTNEAASTAAEQTAVVPSPEASIAATRIATLGGPAVTIEEATAAKADARPDRSAVGKRAQRARERRRGARRARVARQATAQPAADPFMQPAITRGSR